MFALLVFAGVTLLWLFMRKPASAAPRDVRVAMELRTPSSLVVSAKITPHAKTGVGSWTEDGFVSRVCQYRRYALNGAPPSSPETFALMPWPAYSQLEERDLRAICRSLRTLKPIEQKVQTHPSSALAAR